MTINKILLVDDSAAQIEELKSAVNTIGAHVISASSGEEAVAVAKSESPDIIFMDIVMDGMGGYGACRELMKSEETKNIPIVFVSTKDQRADRVWAEKLGARNLIVKPFTEAQILEEVQKYA